MRPGRIRRSRFQNGPLQPYEPMNDLFKRITRIGFGFRRISHYRITVPLCAGKPNWDLLATLAPR